MEPLSIGIIGTGWCGEIRAVAAANSALVGSLHLAEIREERLADVSRRRRVPSPPRPTGRSSSLTPGSRR